MKRTKEQKGITLIALIITIVVLLILAVVAINSIQNDGIISHAGNTANTYNQAVKNEQQHLDNYLSYLDKVNGGSTNNPGSDSEGGSTEGTTYTAYTVGQEVKLKDQTKETGTFYVIENSDESEGTLLMLTKKFVGSTLLQADSGVSGSFSDAETYASSYGENIGGTGRLMTYSEATSLSGDSEFSSKLFALSFWWLGTSNSSGNVYFVTDLEDQRFAAGSPADLSWYVRPVVEISKDLIELVSAE